MTQEELIKEIRRLTPDQRQGIVDAITLESQDGLSTPNNQETTTSVKEDSKHDQRSLSQRLYGILEFEPNPPNDEEVKRSSQTACLRNTPDACSA